METIHLTTREALIWAAVLNAAVGFFLGLIPLCFGIFRNRKRLGILGIFSATVGGAIAGVFLSVPAMAIFTWLIIRSTNQPSEPQFAGSSDAAADVPADTSSDDAA